jgi:hypothetical protein
MFWTFMMLAAIVIAFIRLGALSVWVAVLSLSLKAILALALCIGLLFLWRQYLD